MSNESATDPPIYAASILYHYDEVDHLFASVFGMLTEVDRTVSALHLFLSNISREYNPSLIPFFLGSLYPVGSVEYTTGRRRR